VEGSVGSDEKVTSAGQGQCQCVVQNCKVCTYPMIGIVKSTNRDC